MASIYQKITASHSGTPAATLSIAGVNPGGKNRRLLIGIVYENTSGITISSVASAHGTWTVLDTQSNGGGFSTGAVTWWRVTTEPKVGIDTVVVTASSANLMLAVVYALQDVNQTTPFETPVKSSGNGTSVSNTAGGAEANDLILDILGVNSNTATLTVGADQTYELNIADTNFRGASSSQAGVNGGVMSHTISVAQDWAHIAVAVNHGAGPPQNGPSPLALGPQGEDEGLFNELNIKNWL